MREEIARITVDRYVLGDGCERKLQRTVEQAQEVQSVLHSRVKVLESELNACRAETQRYKDMSEQYQRVAEAEGVRQRRLEQTNEEMRQRNVESREAIQKLAGMRAAAERERGKLQMQLEQKQEEMSMAQMMLSDASDAKQELATELGKIREHMQTMDRAGNELAAAMKDELSHYKNLVHESESALIREQVSCGWLRVQYDCEV